MGSFLPGEKVLALGMYCLAHGNSFASIGLAFILGISTVIEAVQDLVNGELCSKYIKFAEVFIQVSCSELQITGGAFMSTFLKHCGCISFPIKTGFRTVRRSFAFLNPGTDLNFSGKNSAYYYEIPLYKSIDIEGYMLG